MQQQHNSFTTSGLSLGKSASSYEERMRRVQQLAASQPKTWWGGFWRGAGEGAAEGTGNVVNQFFWGLPDKVGLTHTQDYEDNWANRFSRRSAWLGTMLGQTAIGMRGLGAAAHAPKVRHAAQATRAARAAQAARAGRPLLGSTGRAIAETSTMRLFGRPMARVAHMLRSPRYVQQTFQAAKRVPLVRKALLAGYRSKALSPFVRGGMNVLRNTGVLMDAAANTRALGGLGRAAGFMLGEGGKLSRLAVMADALLPGLAGSLMVNPKAEIARVAAGYRSPFIANVSSNPEVFNPMARPLPWLSDIMFNIPVRRKLTAAVEDYNRGLQAAATDYIRNTAERINRL
jgi:hypothetical protein